MKKQLFLFAAILFEVLQINAQVYTNKVVGEKNEGYVDSLKAAEYPYALPIWGSKAAARAMTSLFGRVRRKLPVAGIRTDH